MKNQYFGDVHDYRKYGLLRVLLGVRPWSALVAWMLTPDDGGSDGGRRGYLDDPARWRLHDPDLFDRLAAWRTSGAPPAVEQAERLGLLPGVRFFDVPVPEGRSARAAWSDELARAASGADLVFLDPDNGIEVPSVPIGRKGSSRYVSWEELERLWASGSSLLVYQHFPRKPRAAFTRELLHRLQGRTGAAQLAAFRTSDVVFLLALQPRHAEVLPEVVARLGRQWAGQFRTHARAPAGVQPA